MNLYELTGNYLEILRMAEEGEFEDFKDTLECIDDAIEVKAEGYAKIINTLVANEDFVKKEIDRLVTRKNTIDNNINKLKKNLFDSMQAIGKEKIKTELFNISIRNNASSLKIETEEFIPVEYYIKQEPKLDKVELKNAIKNGLEIKGCSLERSQSLMIK